MAMSNNDKCVAALAILSDLVQSIEAVGVDTIRDEMDWYDLHIIYRDSCVLLEITPMEPEYAYDEECGDDFNDIDVS